eukprot:m.185721 g.185721  ORF g.185721 m.185721 type:complete len:303 (+) comp16540_c0_seq1:229-1137(+)
MSGGASSCNEDADGFTLVKPRRVGRGRTASQETSQSAAPRHPHPPTDTSATTTITTASVESPEADRECRTSVDNGLLQRDAAEIVQRMIDPARRLDTACYVDALVGIIKATPLLAAGQSVQLVAYGVGSYSESMIPRLQFCCLRDMASKLPLSATPELYDPVLTAAERLAAEDQGITVLTKNEMAKRNCKETPTVFFMPHCEKELYNNLLSANWDTDTLANIIIIGNSFAYYEENAMGQDLYETAPYLARACKTVTEKPVPNSVDPHAAFNNTSVHYFDQRGIMQTVQAEPTQTGGPAREPS